MRRSYAEWLDRLRTKVKPVSVALFARQLSTMISAGLPIVRSLRSIARDHEDKKLSAILVRVAEDVEKGEALSAALGKHPSKLAHAHRPACHEWRKYMRNHQDSTARLRA